MASNRPRLTFREAVELEITKLNKEKLARNTSEHGAVKVDTWMSVINQLKSSTQFDPGALLDQAYRHRSAGNHLYEIGMSPYRFGDTERLALHNPYCNLVLILVIIVRSFVSLSLPEHGYERTRVYIADYSHIVGIHYHFHPAMMCLFTTVILSILLNIWNYRTGIIPYYLNVFGVFSGKCSPQHMGLTDSKCVITISKRINYGIITVNWVTRLYLLIGFMLAFVPMVLTYTLMDMLIFGVPWCIVYAWSIYIISQLYLFQLLYLYITCYYLRAKLKLLNVEIRNRTKLKVRRFQAIVTLISKMNSVYKEIDYYNKRYLSKINLFYIFGLSASTALLAFVSIYLSLITLLKIVITFMTLTVIALYLFYLSINSMISIEAFKSYNYLNYLYVEQCKICLPIALNFKISTFIERIALKKIGFYCGYLFLVDNYIIYQILSTTVIYFLKVAELSVLTYYLEQWYIWANVESMSDPIIKYLVVR